MTDAPAATVDVGGVRPVEAFATAARMRHDRVASVADWDCDPDAFDPAAGADGERVYCEHCGLLCLRLRSESE